MKVRIPCAFRRGHDWQVSGCPLDSSDPLNRAYCMVPISPLHSLSLLFKSHASLKQNTQQEPSLEKHDHVGSDAKIPTISEHAVSPSEAGGVFPNPVSENATLILPENISVDVFLLSGGGTLLWTDKNIRSDGKDHQIPIFHP